MDATIGARLKEFRNDLGMTQQELADTAGVSVGLVRHLEQGIRHTASVPSLQKLARALDRTVADLLGKPQALPSPGPDSGVLAIRRALTSVDDLIDEPDSNGEPVNVTDAERTVDYLWGAYWAGRYELLGSLLPDALMRLRATHRAASAADRPRAATALARGLQAAGDTLVHLAQTDAAFLAVREALKTASDSDDELLSPSLRVSVAWQMLVQGRLDDAERVALKAANEIEPVGDAPIPQLALYGILTVTAATAAARNTNAGRTTDLLTVSTETADRLGHDRSAHQTTFGPAKVAMLAVDCHVVQDEFPEALDAAKGLSRQAPLNLATRARHLADVAYCHLRLDHDDQALNTLLAMESMAPDWIKYQTLPRQTVAELVERDKRRVHGSRLRQLARRLGAEQPA